MQIPKAIDGPKMFFGEELFQTAHVGNCGTWTSLGVETERSTKMIIIDEPVSGRNVIIWSCHLYYLRDRLQRSA